MIPEKEVAGRPPWAVCRHYMGLNFRLFFKTGALKRLDFRGPQSDGFTGILSNA
ncbi:MAG: hypothetical protein WAU64_10255 [Methanoregula sp.]|uniref:hypothetical protein n=1 Tax=Methanoregula sp. TaxID=2052170 RepID=UPI003BAE5BAE